MSGEKQSTALVPEVLKGRVAWIFDDDFDVDNIIGVQNIRNYDPDYLRTVCMKSFEANFVDQVKEGDMLVGGRNFGYGHPHYPPLIAMRSIGITAIVAESFSPGFWMGEMFNGFPLITCPCISSSVERWENLEVHWKEGLVVIPDKDIQLRGIKPSERTVEVIEAGGAFNLLLRQYGKT